MMRRTGTPNKTAGNQQNAKLINKVQPKESKSRGNSEASINSIKPPHSSSAYPVS